MPKQRIVLRADGDSERGLGHIVRCIALVEMLKETFECVFIANKPGDSVSKLVTPYCQLIPLNSKDKIEEILQLKNLLKPSDIFVADGYEFNESYQQSIKQMVHKLVIVDDKAGHFFYADVIFNHGDISTIPVYQTSDSTQIYSGLNYLILRKDFLKATSQNRTISKVETAFICMGGADPFGITDKVVNAIQLCPFLKNVIVVKGSVNKSISLQKSLQSSSADQQITYVNNASSSEMVGYISKSDIAISTASSVALEICCVKTPLICGTVIDNQFAIHSQLVKSGCCLSIGNWNSVSKNEIISLVTSLNDLVTTQQIITKQDEYFDGRSVERILTIFKTLAA